MITDKTKQTINLLARNLGDKLIAFAFVFAVLPFNLNAPKTAYETKAIFDQKSIEIVRIEDKKVSIEYALSNTDAKKVKPAVLAYQSKQITHNDPAEFRPVYMQAAKQFNIPWQLIEAVHEVESGKSGSTSKSSYAGAQGPMQFMPGTWRAYQIDGNNDGVSDITDVTDAIYTAAHYLAKSGADEGRYDDALFNYNHSMSYVTKVKTIAQEIGL